MTKTNLFLLLILIMTIFVMHARGQEATTPSELLFQIEDVVDFAVSPNGNLLATGSSNGNIHIWDIESQQSIQIIDVGTQDYVIPLVLSSDNMVAVEVASSINILHIENGNILYVLDEHPRGVSNLAFSPNGELLASAGDLDSLVILWNVTSGEPVLRLDEVGGIVWSLGFSPDGSMLATGDMAGQIIVWDVTTGQEIFDLQGLSNDIYTLEWSDNGNYIGGASNILQGLPDIDAANVAIWDVSTQEQVCFLPQQVDFAFVDEQSFLTVDLSGLVNIYTIENCDGVTLFDTQERILNLEFIKNEKIILTRSSDNILSFWKYYND